MTKLCLNMIVKNEAARIERCLASVVGYVDYIVIMDTGSTDNTVELIEQFIKFNALRGVVYSGEFKSFGQARNDALTLARRERDEKGADFEFLLLMDADMELVVTDPRAFECLRGPSYDMLQKAGAISYMNRRLLNVDVKGEYAGPTHEYLDVPSSGAIVGASFIDHADGANRKDKFERDIVLLTEALKSDPDNGRYWFYLAQSHRDAGNFEAAESCYSKRVSLGGWDEETWNAQVNMAHCWSAMGVEAQFILSMQTAYNMRPRRAETLYDLAKHFREKGENASALLFAERGLAMKRPDDVLFVNDFVYSHGLGYEYSIAAFYDER